MWEKGNRRQHLVELLRNIEPLALPAMPRCGVILALAGSAVNFGSLIKILFWGHSQDIVQRVERIQR